MSQVSDIKSAGKVPGHDGKSSGSCNWGMPERNADVHHIAELQ